MRITSIQAKNFKTLKDVTVRLPTFYNTISGRNNAGKSALVRIIREFFEDETDRFPFELEEHAYKDFRTQWEKDDAEVSLAVDFEIDTAADSELALFIKDLSPSPLNGNILKLRIEKNFRPSGTETKFIANNIKFDERKSVEIGKKLKSVSNLFVYNSTSPEKTLHFTGGRFEEMMEIFFTDDDKQKLSDARKAFTNKVRTVARRHRADLSNALGKLSDAYDVDLISSDRPYGSRFPISISLNDKAVEVPLRNWGAGTQNRTMILLAVVEASRLKSSQRPENTTTPIVLIEEPESFLHPTAQAEFGRVLAELAEDLKIQIICTTHSPYMLNQKDSSSNILLERKVAYGKLQDTVICDTSGERWMKPFAEQLGIIPPEFSDWKHVIFSESSKVVLVEGAIDVEYFEHFKTNYPSLYGLPADVSIEEYGGKDSIKNNTLLKFALSKYQKFIITFDLDADSEVSKVLERMGYTRGDNFIAIGRLQEGAQCIEGLVPERIKRKVVSENFEQVERMSSADAAVRKSARNNLKRKYLEELKASKLDKAEAAPFKALFDDLAKKF